MAYRQLFVLSLTLLLLATTLAAPADVARPREKKQDLEASEKADLNVAASHWGGWGGYGGSYGQFGGYYPHYGSYYGWPGYGGYGSYGGYGWGWPHGGYGHHGYWW